jgi:uncharacterized protein YndB with AHSA1/START domain
MSIMNAKTLAVTINRQPKEVYEYITNPEYLSEWATTFSHSVSQSESGEWVVTPLFFKFPKLTLNYSDR